MSEASGKLSSILTLRFRRGAFGWRSDPVIARIKEALPKSSRSTGDPPLAAEGGVLLGP
jgi:hypothetical protein